MGENLELAIVDRLLEEGVVAFDRKTFLAANPPERDDEQDDDDDDDEDEDDDDDDDGHLYRKNPAIESALRRLLTREHLPSIKRIVWAGGMPIQHLIWNYWDGEDDAFDMASLDGIEGCTSLVMLSVRDANALRDLSPLASLTTLESISIGGGGHPRLVEDITPLLGLPHLSKLDLSHNPTLRDVAALASLTSLEVLDLSDCAVEDYACTLALPKLRQLIARAKPDVHAANAATFAALRERGVAVH